MTAYFSSVLKLGVVFLVQQILVFLLIFFMIVSGFAGTVLGKKILIKYGSKYFKIILNATLTIIAIYLLWNAIIISKILD